MTCAVCRGECRVTRSMRCTCAPKKKDIFQLWLKENRFCAEPVTPSVESFDNLSSCFSIFKAPQGWLIGDLAYMKVHVKKEKVVSPSLEGLRGCDLFNERKNKAVPVESEALTLVLAEEIQDDESICEVPMLPRPISDTGTPRIGTGSWTDDSVQGLADSATMFKEPKGWNSVVLRVNVKKEKEIIAPLEGLRGCSLFTIPTTCSKCNLQGHNSRSCTRTGLIRQFAVLDGECIE